MNQISSNYGVGFRGTASPIDLAVKTVACTTGYDLVEKKPNTAKKVCIALASATALAGIIYGIKHPDKVRGILDKVKKSFRLSQQDSESKILKNMSIDDFKNVGGKLEKGKALVNGKEFTGTLTSKNGAKLYYKEGWLTGAYKDKITKEYNKGKIFRITDYNVEPGACRKETVFLYDNKGRLAKISADGGATTYFKPDGTFIKSQKKIENGYIVERNLKNGQIMSRTKVIPGINVVPS